MKRTTRTTSGMKVTPPRKYANKKLDQLPMAGSGGGVQQAGGALAGEAESE